MFANVGDAMPVSESRKAKSTSGARGENPGDRGVAGKTRENWLYEVTGAMTSWFDDLGFPLPDYQISAGFPSSGRRGRDTAEAWREESSGVYRIFIRPDRHDPYRVAAGLAHQLAHMAAGPRDTHGHLFRHIAISIGLRGRAADARPGRLFQQLVEPVLEKAGPLPEPFLGPAEGVQKAKQKTRLIKVSCQKCGYVARVARKWLDEVGEPLCPRHGPMSADD